MAPGGAGVMLQLTDGTIMVQNGSSANWMRLTPDAAGSYINGVWTLKPDRSDEHASALFRNRGSTQRKSLASGRRIFRIGAKRELDSHRRDL